jgi:glycosyltransferase involved in cell wall biosynthesis
VLLLACQRLARSGLRFKLLIAGLQEKLPDRFRLLMAGLTRHVFYLGFQKDMDAVYARAQVIVLPSRVEPFGMAPVEAMVHGLVPIVSQVSGVAEFLSHEKDGLILKDQLDDEELANLMADLIKQPQKVEILSRQARQTAWQCSWDKTVQATLGAYARVQAGKVTSNDS